MGTISVPKADGPLIVYADIPVCWRIELIDERNIGGIVCRGLPIKPGFFESRYSISALQRRRINLRGQHLYPTHGTQHANNHTAMVFGITFEKLDPFERT
jgi:hypothetical protein